MAHTRSEPVEPARVALVEQLEADYVERFLVGAPSSVREALGVRSRRVNGGTAVAMRQDTSGYWNKFLGFAQGVIDDSVVADVIEFFTEVGSTTALLAVPPTSLPADWEVICRRNGLVLESRWAKLLCATEDFVPGTTDLAVTALAPSDAPAWAGLVRTAFGMPEPDLTPFLEAAIRDPRGRVFGAWDDGVLVGAGAVCFVGAGASLNTGATLTTHRGRGVQSALLSARAQAAADAGCRWLVAETGSPGPDGLGNASYRNLRRAGFRHLYDRPNWRWNATIPSSSSLRPAPAGNR